MKTLFNILFVSLTSLSLSHAADLTNTAQFYRSGVELSAFGSLTTSDLDRERSGVGFGADVFLTPSIGIGASTAIQDLNGSVIDNVSLRGIYRIPINQNAVYGFAGGQRELNAGEWAIIGGIGAERRWTPNFGTFVEVGFHKELTGDRVISAVPSIGVRLAW